MNSNNIIAVDANNGERLMIAGGEYRIIISGQQTNGDFAVIEMTVPPGAGPNPHSHADFEESFYVLEGEVTFKSGAGSYIAKEHSFISIPKGGMVHGFKNLSGGPAKLLCRVTPAGLDEFFREVAAFMQNAKVASLPQAEIKAKLDAMAQKHGQTLYSEDYLD